MLAPHGAGSAPNDQEGHWHIQSPNKLIRELDYVGLNAPMLEGFADVFGECQIFGDMRQNALDFSIFFLTPLSIISASSCIPPEILIRLFVIIFIGYYRNAVGPLESS